MKRIICLLIVFVLVVSGLLGCTFNDIVDWLSTAITINNDNSIEWEEKVYWPGDVNDNFVPGQLLVLLDKAISAPLKVHSPDFFVGVEVVEIRDLNPWADPNDHSPDFHQSLLLILSDKYNTKEATLEAMHILEPILGIVAVEPNLILDPEIASNDKYFSCADSETDQWTLDSIEAPSVWKFINKKALFVI